jgi:hypothetical protein
VHAYVYREGPIFRASIYVLASGQRGGSLPAREVTGRDSADVEADVRAWVDLHFPRQH